MQTGLKPADWTNFTVAGHFASFTQQWIATLIWHFLITELAIESGPDMFIPFLDQVKFPLKISGDQESLAWGMNGSPTRNKQPGETPSFIPLPRDTKANGQCLQ